MRQLLLLLLAITFIFTQEKRAYQSLSFRMNVHNKFSSTDLNSYFSYGKNVDFRVSTPYHRGQFYIGLKRYTFSKKENSNSNFTSNSIYLGWQFALIESKPIQLNFGFHLGSFEMDFDEESSWFYKKESELTTSVQTNLTYSFSRSILFNLEIENQHVYTSKKFFLNTISAGISYSIRTPHWLKRILN